MPSWSEAVTSDSDFFSSKGKAKTAPYSQGTFFLGKMLKIDLFFFSFCFFANGRQLQRNGG